jgi:hypothetical protein
MTMRSAPYRAPHCQVGLCHDCPGPQDIRINDVSVPVQRLHCNCGCHGGNQPRSAFAPHHIEGESHMTDDGKHAGSPAPIKPWTPPPTPPSPDGSSGKYNGG